MEIIAKPTKDIQKLEESVCLIIHKTEHCTTLVSHAEIFQEPQLTQQQLLRFARPRYRRLCLLVTVESLHSRKTVWHNCTASTVLVLGRGERPETNSRAKMATDALVGTIISSHHHQSLRLLKKPNQPTQFTRSHFLQ